MNCPLCNNKLEMVRIGSIYRACTATGCAMFGKDRPYTEFEAITAALAAAERRGFEQARTLCRDCVVPGGNPEVAIDRIDALVYKPQPPNQRNHE